MTTDKTHRDLVKLLHLKEVGIALAGLWVIVFIAAASATIYQEFDGPTVRSKIAENLELSTTNSTLNRDLNSARKDTDVANDYLSSKPKTIDSLVVHLTDSRSGQAVLENQLESYLNDAPLLQIGH